MTDLVRRCPLRFDQGDYLEVKDPCPVHDGRRWHLFGTAVTAPHTFELMHAVADRVDGPWRLLDPVDVSGIEGSCVGAPGVIADDGELHLFLQTDYNVLDGRVEHLVSTDGGASFGHEGTVLISLPGTAEAGIYDPHPARVGERRYLVYSAFGVVGQPDLHFAVSRTDSWQGPWERLGPLLRHQQVGFHNQVGDRDYEWGLEGGQLVELPDGRVLLNAVCFLTGPPAGARQRVFFALSDAPTGPFAVVGPALAPPVDDDGENGHACAVLDGDDLRLFLQERSVVDGRWRYALAAVDLPALNRHDEEAAV